MTGDYWLKQSKDKALFEDLLWSRPENKRNAGKLLIIGGSNHGFKAPATAYNHATVAGIGTVRIIMPVSLRASIGKYIDDPIFAPANISGGLSQEALAELLENAVWSDLVLLPGNLGHNSETSILIESFAGDYKEELCICGDAIDAFTNSPDKIFNRPKTLIVTELSTLQKLLIKSGSTVAITSNMNLMQLVELLSELTTGRKLSIITSHQSYFIAATDGRVSTTEYGLMGDWELKLAAYCSVWWLQNKEQPFKSLTTAIYDSLGHTATP